MATASHDPRSPVRPRDFEDRWEELEPHLRQLVVAVFDACVPFDHLNTEDDLLGRLSAMHALHARIDEAVKLEVQQLRQWQEMAWPAIGDALGMTRQGARQRYQDPSDGAAGDEEELWDVRLKELGAQLQAQATRLRIDATRAGRDPEPELEHLMREHLTERVWPEMEAHLARLAQLRAAAKETA